MQTVTEKEVNAGLTQASDAAFINAFTADGTPIKISKADLASVVAGQTATLYSYDFNTLLSAGSYYTQSLGAHGPSISNPSYPIFIEVVKSTPYVMQRVTILVGSPYKTEVYTRLGWGNTSWSDWVKLS